MSQDTRSAATTAGTHADPGAEQRRLAVARLREGTEVLRTGGGTTLTASQCNLLLDYIEHLERLAERWKHNAAEWERLARKDSK